MEFTIIRPVIFLEYDHLSEPKLIQEYGRFPSWRKVYMIKKIQQIAELYRLKITIVFLTCGELRITFAYPIFPINIEELEQKFDIQFVGIDMYTWKPLIFNPKLFTKQFYLEPRNVKMKIT